MKFLFRDFSENQACDVDKSQEKRCCFCRCEYHPHEKGEVRDDISCIESMDGKFGMGGYYARNRHDDDDHGKSPHKRAEQDPNQETSDSAIGVEYFAYCR